MKKIKNVFSILCGISLLFLAACAGSSKNEIVKQDYVQIFQHSWKLNLQSMTENYDNTISAPKRERDAILTVVPENEVFGQSFVNSYFGPVKLDTGNGTLQFGALGSTMMAGPDLNIEQKYFMMLSQVTSYAILNNTLILYGKDKDGNLKKFAEFTPIPLIKQ